MQDLLIKWFKWTAGILVVLATTYILLHCGIKGAQIAKLSKDEAAALNAIINNSAVQKNTAAPTNMPASGTTGSKEEGKKDVQNQKGQTNPGAGVPAPTPSANPPQNPSTGTPTPQESKPDAKKDSIKRIEAWNFLRSIRHLTPADSINAKKYFENYDNQQFAAAAGNYPFEIKSYFWLTDYMVYLEIIFWSLFGLIANLLYTVSEALRTQNFDLDEVGVHVAKFFYTPLCALIIYFSLNVVISKGDVKLSDFSNGTIVLAFILGFFSGRTIELLNKVKDLLLPLGTTNQATSSYSVNGHLTGPAGVANPDYTQANVTLQSLTNPALVKTIKADSGGMFSFTSLSQGNYSVNVDITVAGTTYKGSDTNFPLTINTPNHQSSIQLA